MATHVSMKSGIAPTSGPAFGTTSLALVLAVWLLAVSLLGARGAFFGAPGTPPLVLLVAFVVPLLVFSLALRASGAFRAFVLGVDPRVMLAMQAWRFAGFGFLALQAHAILPAYFAWPAGVGDMAIGLTAPLMMATLNRRPEFASSRRFVVWNLLGMVDLVVAISLGAVGSFLLAHSDTTITTIPMAGMPLVLIPAFLVPLFLMMHITALLQARSRRRLTRA
jgi:hypothetical protein